jgi:hypothetical protein
METVNCLFECSRRCGQAECSFDSSNRRVEGKHTDCDPAFRIVSTSTGALKSLQGSENRTRSHGENFGPCVFSFGFTVYPGLTGYAWDPNNWIYMGP